MEAETDKRPTAYRLPQLRAIVHLARDYVIDVQGKPVRFQEGNYGGPALTKRNGDPIKNQPGARHPFWKAYEAWHGQGRLVRDGNVCVYELPPEPRCVWIIGRQYTTADYDDPRTDAQIREAFIRSLKNLSPEKIEATVSAAHPTPTPPAAATTKGPTP